MSNTKHIAYTDGGCLGVIGGYGVHMYLWSELDEKAKIKRDLPTDKGYILHPEKDKGKPVKVDKIIDVCGPIEKEATNNIAELKGLIWVLEYVLDDTNTVTDIQAYLDSKYVLDGIKALPQWIARGWRKSDGDEVKNLELWQSIHKYLTAIKEKNISISFGWVKGHQKPHPNYGNDNADTNATRAIALAADKRFDVIVSEIDPTIKPKDKPKLLEASRFFDKPKMYFVENVDTDNLLADGRFVYHCGNHGDDDELFGKPMVDASFSVVALKDKDEVIDSIRRYHNSRLNHSYRQIVMLMLDRITAKNTYKHFQESGTTFLTKDPLHNNQYLDRTKLITREHTPPRMADQAAEYIGLLENILRAHTGGLHKELGLKLTDITGTLYMKGTGKKETMVVAPGVTQQTAQLTLAVDYEVRGRAGSSDVVLTLGTDIPRRNTLSALACDDVKVYIVTWPVSNNRFRYATIIESDGNVGIWASYSDNLGFIVE